jgi:hypothetical protein
VIVHEILASIYTKNYNSRAFVVNVLWPAYDLSIKHVANGMLLYIVSNCMQGCVVKIWW